MIATLTSCRRRKCIRLLLLLASCNATIVILVQLASSITSFSVDPFVVDTSVFENERTINPVFSMELAGNITSRYVDDKAGIAACLLIMDDNHFLVEWLAYHFYYLPLRRLIVAVDPKSKTSPKSILERYHSRGLINITLWNDVDFLPILMKRLFRRYPTDLYIIRQEYFILECMKKLQGENWTWATHIDTDEFVVPNRDADAIYHFDKNQTVYAVLTNPPPNEHWKNLTTSTPCHPMIRPFMGIRPARDQVANRGVPDGFNGSKFLTYRYRSPQPTRPNGKLKPGKAFLDLSRVPSSDFRRGNTNPHRILKNRCEVFIHSRRSPFSVFHYSGSYEQFNYRRDGRNTKTRELYKQRDFNSKYDDGAAFWLPGFMEQVGIELARTLLAGAVEIGANWNA